LVKIKHTYEEERCKTLAHQKSKSHSKNKNLQFEITKLKDDNNNADISLQSLSTLLDGLHQQTKTEEIVIGTQELEQAVTAEIKFGEVFDELENDLNRLQSEFARKADENDGIKKRIFEEMDILQTNAGKLDLDGFLMEGRIMELQSQLQAAR